MPHYYYKFCIFAAAQSAAAAGEGFKQLARNDIIFLAGGGDGFNSFNGFGGFAFKHF